MSKVKNALTTETKTLLATPPQNPWLKVATEDGSSGQLLKFVKSRWVIGDDEVPIGTEFIAHIDQLLRGWTKFEDGAVTDRIVGKIADNWEPPPRSELSDPTAATWREKDTNGQLRDPWSLQWYLPMVGVDGGEVVTYVTGSEGGHIAIKNLCYSFAYQRCGLPIVGLQKRSYRHPKFGILESPKLQIVGWDGVAVPTMPPPEPLTSQQKSEELNDEIPEF